MNPYQVERDRPKSHSVCNFVKQGANRHEYHMFIKDTLNSIE